MQTIGRPVPRKEGRDKVTGQARYVDDLIFPEMLYGATVRSAVARGRIKKISFEGNIPWDEFTIVTAKDIPGENCVALILLDQPYLADEFINHPEEPILLLAHPDKHLLEEARRNVQLEIEPLPAIFTLEDSLNRKEIIWGEDNLFKSYKVEKGNVDEVWQSADFIIEGEYETGAQEQLYIENNGVIAIASPEDGVTVWGSMQCPYYVHKALLKLFGLPEDKIRVVQVETGGGFGGKEEYPSMIAGHAALLSWKSGRPVKIVYDRAEDMASTTKRHPSWTKHRTAVSRDGKLLGMEIDFVIDGGAYATLSAVVLSRGTIHAAGPYSCPNVRIKSRAVATNAPPHGEERFAESNKTSRQKKGMGFASFMHGAGFTGSGEKYLESVVGAEATADGRVRILAASTEIGQGTNTIFAQIAAEALRLDYDSIEVAKPDTGAVPNSGPTVASRTCMIVGKLVESAVLGLKQTLSGSGLLKENYTQEDFRQACRSYIEQHGALKSYSKYKAPPGINWDDEKYEGDAYGAYAWAVYVAEVTIDTVTYEARVDDFVAVQEVGKVIHPILAAGQIEGGVAQAIGYTLFENVVWKDGRMINNQMTNYIIPTAADIPPIRVFFEENPYAYGPAGAKGIGELPMDGAAPAILNAIENATGASINHIPLMPESLIEALGGESG
ncbi:MAG: carbon monoxide dehydrogenase [Acidobacteria bacterium]|nr:MAG: carbon monoxide dehydrogenase [Acidobacteriota bacterium]